MAELASLPLFHQITGQKVLGLGEGEVAEPKRRLVERAGGQIIAHLDAAIAADVRLAFVALNDAEACESAADTLRQAGMLVNVVDRPDLCDFTTPSLLDRDPLLIAIGTGGASAGLAKHVRLRLEKILPSTLGRLADALKAVRPALRERFPDGGERRKAIDTALREGGALAPLPSSSHERVAQWAEGVSSESQASTFVFDLHSQDPEALTLRQARLLGEADAVCTQGRVSRDILARARADAARIECQSADCPLRKLVPEADGLSTVSCPVAAATLDGENLTVILRGDEPE